MVIAKANVTHSKNSSFRLLPLVDCSAKALRLSRGGRISSCQAANPVFGGPN